MKIFSISLAKLETSVTVVVCWISISLAFQMFSNAEMLMDSLNVSSNNATSSLVKYDRSVGVSVSVKNLCSSIHSCVCIVIVAVSVKKHGYSPHR